MFFALNCTNNLEETFEGWYDSIYCQAHRTSQAIIQPNYYLHLCLFNKLSEIMFRVTVCENESATTKSRIIPILPSMEEFLNKICEDFGSPDYKLIYTANGALISDVSLMR